MFGGGAWVIVGSVGGEGAVDGVREVGGLGGVGGLGCDDVDERGGALGGGAVDGVDVGVGARVETLVKKL